MYRRIVCLCAVFWLFLPFGAPAAEEEAENVQDLPLPLGDPAAEENAQADRNAKDDFLAVWFTGSKCDDPEDRTQPGSTRENPVVKTVYDVVEDSEKLDCRWVKLSGYVRSLHYYHYRDVLFETIGTFYAFNTTASPQRLIVENYADENLSHWEIQGAQVEVTGRFYDLCAHAERIQKERNETWWIFGPCHYGQDRGMMLQDVQVIRRLSPPYQRITGERNRPLVGTLVDVPKDWAELSKIRDAAHAWLEAARKGRRALEEFVFGPDAHARAAKDQELAEALGDRDSRIAFLTTSAKSPLRRLRKSPARPRLRLFMPYEAFSGRDRKEWDQAAACFCVHGTCRDVWPLFEEDVRDMVDDYVCVKLWRKKTGWAVN